MTEEKRIAKKKLFRDAQKKVMQSNKSRSRVGGPGIGGRKKIRGSSVAEDRAIKSIYKGKRLK